FMEAPVLSKLCDLFQDTSYCAKLYAMYNDTKTRRGLYDTTIGLWYQFAGFIRPKILWARANGWVMAAHVRVLEHLPADDPHRNEYIATLQSMAAALKARQRADGFWNVSLPAPGTPETYPGPETSSTALFTYAMAWGINQGYLNRNTYTPVVLKAWDGMVRDAVHPNGKVGYVQGVGNDPSDSQPVTYESTELYGVGAFLLAGSEVAKLQEVNFLSACQ
ncbi:MAG TPA: glycoside hydrolase family 88 protein, partial [Candidatus Tectomicrobia bacterium]